MPAQKTTELPIYQLRVSLIDSPIPVWRRFLVHRDTPLDELHYVLQVVMGWEGYHLHMFTVRGMDFGEPDPELECEDEQSITLAEIFTRVRQKIEYEYDFGDSWEHEIVFEKRLPEEDGMHYPICIEGQNACPPEDCGGVWGYAELLNALAEPDDLDHAELLEWVGEEFDPEYFDMEMINGALANAPHTCDDPSHHHHHEHVPIGQLPPRHFFVLNPFQDARFSRCPQCDDLTRQRQFALVLYLDDAGLTAIDKTSRYCPNCDILIVHENELDTELEERLQQINPAAVGKEYTIVGTLERKIWRKGKKQELLIDEVLANTADFKGWLEVVYEPGGWVGPDD